ncbi:MAG: hypothetical protein KF850_28475 [Labilithrix sp.]|nr:hypothetical protein [Labilithrix sp.]MBX3216009.1 hypothetical protein [Labilithrix sp.]
MSAASRSLEAGSFQLPAVPSDTTQIAIDGSTFASLLAGIDFTAARSGWYRIPSTRSLPRRVPDELIPWQRGSAASSAVASSGAVEAAALELLS